MPCHVFISSFAKNIFWQNNHLFSLLLQYKTWPAWDPQNLCIPKHVLTNGKKTFVHTLPTSYTLPWTISVAPTQTHVKTTTTQEQTNKNPKKQTSPSKNVPGTQADHVDAEVLCLVVKKLRSTRICPMPIRMMRMDSPIDQYNTRSFKSSANTRPWASRSRKWVWRSRTFFSSSKSWTAEVSIYTTERQDRT